MFRFSRDRRFDVVSHRDFMEQGELLQHLLMRTWEGAGSTVRSSEDDYTYSCAKSSYWFDHIEEVLKNRARYEPQDFSREAWRRSRMAEFIVTPPQADAPAFASVRCDILEEPDRLFFYAQGIDEEEFGRLRAILANPSLLWRIGDGWHRRRGAPRRAFFGFNFRPLA